MDSEYQNQITSDTFSKERMKSIFKSTLAVFTQEKIGGVEITYGFAWGNEIYESVWTPILVSPEKVEALVQEQTDKGTGEIGQDDFYIELKSEMIQIQFCHENDIHLNYQQNSPILEKIKSVLNPDEWIWMKKSNETKWKKIN